MFIPEEGELEGVVEEIKTAFSDKFGLNDFTVSSSFGAEKSMSNESTSLNIGGHSFNVSLVNWDYVNNAISTFRPYIRGFISFMLVLYSINQFMGLIGQPGLSIGIGGLIGSSRGNEDKEGK